MQAKKMMIQDAIATVYIVDDDFTMRECLESILAMEGYRVISLQSGSEFLLEPRSATPACAILDLELPDMLGTDIHCKIIDLAWNLPVIFLTGFGSIPVAIDSLKQGAFDFLTKPVLPGILLETVRKALTHSSTVEKQQIEQLEAETKLDSLTFREREVLSWLIAGRLNKEVADRLGITERTVKEHRGNIVRKLNATSLVDLVRLCERAGLKRADEKEKAWN